MTLTHRTKNPWHIGSKNSAFNHGDTLTILNRPDGVEILAARALGVLDYTWTVRRQHKNGKIQYVYTNIPDPRGGRTPTGQTKRILLLLHRLIMENVPHRPDQSQIDHIDGNPLNNRLDNLRWVTRSVNAQNQRDTNDMPLRGVSARHYLSQVGRQRPWRAMIRVDGQKYGDKSFSTAREAEEHYLKLKRQYHPETPEIWYEQYAECQATGYWD